MTVTSTLTGSGDVAIPDEILRQLDLAAGTILSCEITDGGILLRPTPQGDSERPAHSGRKISGLLSHLATSNRITVADMSEAVEVAAVERYERST